jgi:hypothetical protein
MSNTMNMSRKKRGAKNRQNNSRAMISHPPPINKYEIRHNTRLRFVTNAAVSLGVTFQNLLDLILFATGATTVFDVFTAVKVRAVEVWTVPALGTATTATVIFNGTSAALISDQSIHTDTSMGIEPAHVIARPEPRSLAANYQESSGSSAAFVLIAPTGSVVDVELSFVGVFVSGNAAQNAAVGATAGDTYLRGLDGLATATTKLPPAISAYAI